MRIAAALEVPMTVAHRDRRSILQLDREPVRWGSRFHRGVVFAECADPVAPGALGSWRDAALAGGAGLELRGRTRRLHSTVSGLMPLYWLAERDAVYFASSVDALAATCESLDPDWESWAAILTIGNPIGDRTTFAQIRRLPPFAELQWRRGKATVTRPEWPWAAISPSLGTLAGTDLALEAMRDAVDRLPEHPIEGLLSGGWDSRILVALTADARRDDLSTLTVNMDQGDDIEEVQAQAVAEHLGIPNRIVAGTGDDYERHLEELALSTDFQFVSTPFLRPALDHLRPGTTLLNGLALDTLSQPGGRYITDLASRNGGTPLAHDEVWAALRGTFGDASVRGLRPRWRRTLIETARAQFLAEASRFDGHPSSALLSFFVTRTLRGVATAAWSFGGRNTTAVPFVGHDVASALLSVHPANKLGAAVYKRLFERIDPALAGLSSSNDPVRIEATAAVPQRSRTSARTDYTTRILASGPLSKGFSRPLQRAVAGTRNARYGGLHRTTTALSLFHLWERRYRRQLGEVNAARGLGVRG